MVTVKSDESMARHQKMYFTPNSYLRLIHQPCWLCVCIATVTVKMVHCYDTLILKTKTKNCAINKERLLQTFFAKSCLISWHF